MPETVKTEISFDDENKIINLKCDNDLWEYIQEIKKNNFSNFGIIDIARIWQRVKHLFPEE